MHLALFPLELVVFPGELLNLHIFEPRYKQLIKEVQEDGLRFGIPAFKKGRKLLYGTEINLKSISKTYAEGAMDIKTVGVKAFKIINFERKMAGKPYPAGDIEFIDNIHDADDLLAKKILNKVKEMYSLMDVKTKLPESADEFYIYSIAHKLGLSYNQELHLLTLTKESERQEFIYDHLSSLIPIIRETEAMKKKIKMNGHFKNVIPPEV